ncbi:MAG: hypothetical protein ACKPKO_42935, partial [Candidatus Fonsibacter sp.]
RGGGGEEDSDVFPDSYDDFNLHLPSTIPPSFPPAVDGPMSVTQGPSFSSSTIPPPSLSLAPKYINIMFHHQGKALNCIVRTDATVLALKLILTNKIYEDCEKIYISYNDQLLDDDDAVIGEIGIPNNTELNLIVGDPHMAGGGGKRGHVNLHATTPKKRSTEDNPFSTVDVIKTTTAHKALFEQVYVDCIAVHRVESIGCIKELTKLTSEKLHELEKYFITDNTRHAQKVLQIASEMVVSTQMQQVASLVASSAEVFETYFAADLWLKSI